MAASGERFVAVALGEATDPEAIHVVLDWDAELRRLAPGKD